MKKTYLALFMVLAAGMADAAQVGLVFDYGTGRVDTECVEVPDGASGYVLLKAAETRVSFTDYGPGLGHFIERIGGIGTEVISGAPCYESRYWARYDRRPGGSSYQVSYGSLDGDSDPYSAEDGGVMGWAYGFGDFCTFETPELSTKPGFCEICECSNAGKRMPRVMGYVIRPLESAVENASTQETILPLTEKKPIEVELVDNRTGKAVRNAVVEVFSGVAGITPPLRDGKTGKDGRVVFDGLNRGDYLVRVSGTQYPHMYLGVSVMEATTTTTSTTSTVRATTSTARATTTTLSLPKHLNIIDEPAKPKNPPLTNETYEKPDVIQNKEVEKTGFWDWLTGLFV